MKNFLKNLGLILEMILFSIVFLLFLIIFLPFFIVKPYPSIYANLESRKKRGEINEKE
jgi:hypothetical protein